MPISVALSLLLFAFGPQGISTISDFTNVSGDSLKARYDSAMRRLGFLVNQTGGAIPDP